MTEALPEGNNIELVGRTASSEDFPALLPTEVPSVTPPPSSWGPQQGAVHSQSCLQLLLALAFTRACLLSIYAPWEPHASCWLLCLYFCLRVGCFFKPSCSPFLPLTLEMMWAFTAPCGWGAHCGPCITAGLQWAQGTDSSCPHRLSTLPEGWGDDLSDLFYSNQTPFLTTTHAH